jgi:two-component system sensor histidine kinase YesM
LYKFALPKLITQPIIENAINHGTANMKGIGIIGIFIRKNENRIIISIRDNGPGFSLESIRMINSSNNMPEDILKQHDSRNGIGLQNINSRLKLYYNDDCSFSVSNLQHGGACVEIGIPLWTIQETIRNVKFPIETIEKS